MAAKKKRFSPLHLKQQKHCEQIESMIKINTITPNPISNEQPRVSNCGVNLLSFCKLDPFITKKKLVLNYKTGW